jgi:hypothetical protein
MPEKEESKAKAKKEPVEMELLDQPPLQVTRVELAKAQKEKKV